MSEFFKSRFEKHNHFRGVATDNYSLLPLMYSLLSFSNLEKADGTLPSVFLARKHSSVGTALCRPCSPHESTHL